MSEFAQIMESWHAINQRLDRNWRLNLEVIRKANLDKARKKISSLIWVAGITVAFYLIAGSALMHFAYEHLASPLVAGSAVILTVWCIIVASGAIHELVLLGKIDYNRPILQLQKDLLEIKLTIIRYLRVVVWILPSSFVFIPIFFSVLFGVDITEHAPMDWIIWNLVICIFLFAPASYWLSRKLSPKNVDKKWMNKVLKGSGSQIDDAIVFLREIEEFEQEESVENHSV